jgi:uncharacterized protein YukE
MTMALGKEMDGTTVQATVQEMEKVDADCDAAQRSIDNTRSYLGSNWHGAAQSTFISSIDMWQDGLNKVKRGLADLNTAMVAYYQTSVQLEEDRSQNASWT